MNPLKRLSEHKYYIFYKPFNVLNQFSKERPDHVTLADFLNVPKDVYPLGRLDKDSEGLLILTNDKALNSLLLSPNQKHERTYFVQLDQDITDKAIQQVAHGVQIKLDTTIYHTSSCTVKKLQKAPALPERNPPIRVRKEIPTSWALITLTEGKNRQVRRMFSAVGFPVLRLVRVQIEDVKIGKLNPGEHLELKGVELYKMLNIDPEAAVQPKKKPREVTLKPKKTAIRRSLTNSAKSAKSGAKTDEKPTKIVTATKSSKPATKAKPTTKASYGSSEKPKARTTTSTRAKTSTYKDYRGKK
jgi:23S rRNA pseudouridine2457 synthase